MNNHFDDELDFILGSGDLERVLLRRQRKILLGYEVCSSEANEVIEDFHILVASNRKPITLILSSPGGESTAGMAIIRAVRAAQAEGIEVRAEVYGQAMSMAFLIMQFCDVRTMGTGDILMAHGVTTWIPSADMKDIEAERKILMWFQELMAKQLATRSTAPEGSDYRDSGFWHALMDSNTPVYFTSQEAVEAGLVDHVV